jgi:hypothetical protein
MTPRHQLKTVIPVSFSDVHLLEPWINVFRAQGGAKNHPVEFHPTPSVAGITKEAANAIKNFCGSVEVFVGPQDYKGGWPMACNAHFGVVVRSLANRGNQLPWIWNELDMLPMVPRWSDTLVNEYVLTGGRGAMGVIMPMVKTRDRGKPSEFIFIDKSDPYMVGAGIYDADHHALCAGITDNAFRQTEPFDFAYRFYVKKMWRSTSLISSASRTINYREGENGEILMDDIEGKKEHQKRGGSVPHGTVLHHGCKDRSLADLLINRAGWKYQTIDQMLANVANEAPKTAPALPAPPPRQLAEQHRVAAPKVSSDAGMASNFAAFKAQTAAKNNLPATLPPAPKPPAPEPVALESEPVAPESDPLAEGLEGLEELESQPEAPQSDSGEPEGEPQVTLEVLKKTISEAAKPMKIEAFAQQLGTTEAQIKSLVKQPKSGVNIVGGVWLKLGS